MTDFIKVRTSDDCIIFIDHNIIQLSLLLTELFKDFGLNFEINEDDIPNVQIERSILCKIIQYMEYHKKNPPIEIKRPLESNDLNESGISSWDLSFIDNNKDILIELVNASEYLGINSLMHLICAKLASMLLERTNDEIRILLNLSDDEFNEAQKHNNWYEHGD
tara:strand:- start:9060 stop:9551 length:492 start_codon:yes stop_codon:yes gene_type:complete